MEEDMFYKAKLFGIQIPVDNVLQHYNSKFNTANLGPLQMQELADELRRLIPTPEDIFTLMEEDINGQRRLADQPQVEKLELMLSGDGRQMVAVFKTERTIANLSTSLRQKQTRMDLEVLRHYWVYLLPFYTYI